MSQPIVMDVTELIGSPVRTGIQRVVRSVLRAWPDQDNLHLCRFIAGRGLVMVDDEVRPWLTDATPAALTASPEEVARHIAPLLSENDPPVPADLPILVPELFFNPERCAHHRALLAQNPNRIAYVVYDMIPWLHPQMIGVKSAAPLMHYLALIRDARNLCFISQATRQEFASRIRRQPGLDAAALEAIGPVIPLGSDGPPIPRQSFSAHRRTYLCVGSVDGRKNQESVIAAFRTLWSRGSDARLVIVGRVFDQVRRAGGDAALLALANEPRFTHLSDISDEAMAGLYGQARATIFASHLEGYGLPPMESLLAGVPVIVSAQTPSIEFLPPLGHIRVDPPDAAGILDAVLQLEADATAEMLWEEAASLTMPVWQRTAAELNDWFEREQAA